VCCDGCPNAYHIVCLSSSLHEDDLPDPWFCPKCVDKCVDKKRASCTSILCREQEGRAGGREGGWEGERRKEKKRREGGREGGIERDGRGEGEVVKRRKRDNGEEEVRREGVALSEVERRRRRGAGGGERQEKAFRTTNSCCNSRNSQRTQEVDKREREGERGGEAGRTEGGSRRGRTEGGRLPVSTGSARAEAVEKPLDSATRQKVEGIFVKALGEGERERQWEGERERQWEGVGQADGVVRLRAKEVEEALFLRFAGDTPIYI